MRRVLLDSMLMLALVGLGGLVLLGNRPAPDAAWDRVAAQGVLRIGTDPTYPPFESVVGGQYTGYDIALGQAMGERLGVRVTWVPLALDGQYDALLAGQVDVLLSALPFIYERQQEVRYSQPYFQAGPVLVVRAGDGRIAGPADLAGRRVAVELGSDADMAARRVQRTLVPGLHLDTGYHSTTEALAALATGQADAAVADPLGLAAVPDRAALRALTPPLDDTPYVAVVKMDSPRLAAALDATIAEAQASGALAHMMGAP